MEAEHHGFAIAGDQRFVEQTVSALNLLKNKSPAGYQLAKDYIGRIRQTNERSGMDNFESPPTFYVNDRTAYAGLEWYASCIVHDAVHAREHRQYVTRHPVFGFILKYSRDLFRMGWKKEEKRCLEIQHSALLDMGQTSLAEYVKSLDGTHFRHKGIW